MTTKLVLELLRQTYHEWNEAKAPRLGAALAYYTVFSISPLLIIAIAIAGLVFGEEAARGGIVREIEGTVGRPVAEAIEGMLQQTHSTGSCTLTAVIGLIVLLAGATGVFIQLQDALNTIWKVEPKPDRGILGMLRDRFLSFTVVLGVGFLLLVSLVISAALAALSKFLTPEALPGGAYLWQVVNGVISFGLITLLFALIYKVLPDVPIRWRDVWVGAAVTALLFTLGKYLLGLYLGQSGAASAFGAAGSLILILLWVYYSSQILLFGAEFTRVYATHFGPPLLPTENSLPVSGTEQASMSRPMGTAVLTHRLDGSS